MSQFADQAVQKSVWSPPRAPRATVAPKAGSRPTPATTAWPRTRVTPAALLALQRAAGNAAAICLVQRDPQPVDQNYTGEQAIQNRLAELEEDKDTIGADLVAAQQKDPSQAEKLQDELTVVEREILVLERLHDAGMKSTDPNGPRWNRTEKDVARVIDAATAAARTEKDTLGLLDGEDLRAGRIASGEVTPALLENPDLFRATTLELYRRVTAEMQKRGSEHAARYAEQVKDLANRPLYEAIADYVRIRNSWSNLDLQARRTRWDVQLQPFSPVQLRQRRPGSPDVVVDQLDILVHTVDVDRTVKGTAGGLGTLRAPLQEWELATAYGDVAATMNRFTIAFQTNAPPGVGIGAFRGNLVEDLRFAAGNEVASSEGFLVDAGRVMRRRLDAWVAGLSWDERIKGGFWLYDLGGKIGARLKAMLSLETLATIVGFIAFLAALQLVPFGGLVVDAILAITVGLDLIKGIFLFATYFDAASDATTFESLYSAAVGLQGAEESVVNLMFTLVGAAAGKLLGGYAKYRTGRTPATIDEAAREPVIRDDPALRKAAEDAKQARKSVKDLKSKEPGKWSPEPGVLKAKKTSDGHTIKATESGKFVECSLCDEIVRKYAAEIEADAKAGGTVRSDLDTVRKELDDAIARNDDMAAEAALQKVVDLRDKVRGMRKEMLGRDVTRVRPDPNQGEAGLHLEDMLDRPVEVLDDATKARLGKEGDFIDPRSGTTYDAVRPQSAWLRTVDDWNKALASVDKHLFLKDNVGYTFIDLSALTVADAQRVRAHVATVVKTRTPKAPPKFWPP
jgi:hypothetical protein